MYGSKYYLDQVSLDSGYYWNSLTVNGKATQFYDILTVDSSNNILATVTNVAPPTNVTINATNILGIITSNFNYQMINEIVDETEELINLPFIPATGVNNYKKVSSDFFSQILSGTISGNIIKDIISESAVDKSVTYGDMLWILTPSEIIHITDSSTTYDIHLTNLPEIDASMYGGMIYLYDNLTITSDTPVLETASINLLNN